MGRVVMPRSHTEYKSGSSAWQELWSLTYLLEHREHAPFRTEQMVLIMQRYPPSLNPFKNTANCVIAVASFFCCTFAGMNPVAVVLWCGLCLFVHSLNKLCNGEREAKWRKRGRQSYCWSKQVPQTAPPIFFHEIHETKPVLAPARGESFVILGNLAFPHISKKK